MIFKVIFEFIFCNFKKEKIYFENLGVFKGEVFFDEDSVFKCEFV